MLKEAMLRLPGQICAMAKAQNCDLLLLAGDLFDGKATRDTLDLLKAALRDCGVPVFITPGNHDYCGHGSPWLEDTWPENVHIFTGAMESIPLPHLDCRVYGAAFQRDESPALLQAFRAECHERYAIAVLHGDPVQRNSPYNPITASQVRGSSLDYLALGHIHRAGAFRSGSTLCAWPGCPMGRGWDETGETGVCIVTLGEEPEIRAVSLDTLRFYDLEVEIGRDALSAMEAVLPAAPSRNFYRVSLTGSGEVDLADLKAHFPGLPHLELRDKTQPPVDVWAVAEEDSLEGIYFGMLRKAMEQDPANADRIQRAAEISRKLLSGREVLLP